MTTQVEVEPKPDLRKFQEHWQDEGDAAYLYGILSGLEPDPKRASVFSRLRECAGKRPCAHRRTRG